MLKQSNRIPPALRHGCYSGLTLLPTEDRVLFDKLHRDLVAEYQPAGRSEEIIVGQLAHLMWRRENLPTYLLSEHAKKRYSAIYSSCSPPSTAVLLPLQEEETRPPEEVAAIRKEADERAKRELGPALELLEFDAATTDHLLRELALVDRLDGTINRCLKQLLFVRGVKSMSLSTSAEPSQPRIKKVA
jgi:hypothetical protein